jgi:hypothetical protein
VKAFHFEFQQTLWDGLWGTMSTPFMAYCKLDFILDQYLFTCCSKPVWRYALPVEVSDVWDFHWRFYTRIGLHHVTRRRKCPLEFNIRSCDFSAKVTRRDVSKGRCSPLYILENHSRAPSVCVVVCVKVRGMFADTLEISREKNIQLVPLYLS